MKTPRALAGKMVPAIGLGCMNLSHAYGAPPPPGEATQLLHAALDIGITHFDTAALYGFGKNEELVGEALKPHRQKIFLASKCGMTGIDGKRVIDGRPQTLLRTCDEGLQRLQTDFIDLYYLHRFDKAVPIEDSVGALAELVRLGKIGGIGLSEVSASTLRRAHAVHPIAAVQSEYSLWTRNPEIGVLAACRELGTTFVAFSPVARGFLAEPIAPASLAQSDIRRNMPRFVEPDYSANKTLFDRLALLAKENGVTPAQLSLQWVLAQGEEIVAIPGTTNIQHLKDNANAMTVALSPNVLRAAGEIINEKTVSGPRYNAATQAEIDTEKFPFEAH